VRFSFFVEKALERHGRDAVVDQSPSSGWKWLCRPPPESLVVSGEQEFGGSSGPERSVERVESTACRAGRSDDHQMQTDEIGPGQESREVGDCVGGVRTSGGIRTRSQETGVVDHDDLAPLGARRIERTGRATERLVFRRPLTQLKRSLQASREVPDVLGNLVRSAQPREAAKASAWIDERQVDVVR
jgi:hypothetical protein